MKKDTSEITAEITTDAATVVTYRRNDASLRVEKAALGIGLNSAGTYVSKEVSEHALAASIEAVTEGKLKWAAGRHAFILTGNKGQVLRFGRISTCAQFGEIVSSSGAKGVISLAIFGEKGSVQVMTEEQLAASLSKVAEANFIRSHDKLQFTGKLIGSIASDAKYASVAYALNGKLVAVDIETRANAYNSGALGALGGKDESMSKRTATLISKLADGAKAVKKTVKKKAKKEVTEESTEASK